MLLWYCCVAATAWRGDATGTRIAFGSCHKNYRATVPSIWEQVVVVEATAAAAAAAETAVQDDETPLDAFVWTGDAMYPSNRDPVTHKKRYGPAPASELQQGLDAMKTNDTIGYTKLLKANIPVYGVWDDHDYGGNDMGKYMPDRQERQDVFWNFLGYRPHSHDGMYHSIDIYEKLHHKQPNNGGHIKLIFLDTRWFRDDHCIPSVAHKLPMGNAMACATRWATAGLNLWKWAGWWGKKGCERAGILGEDQWKWLREELFSSPADLHIIVSSIQIWSTNPAMESWGQFPLEQERLWNLLQEYYQQSRSKAVAPVMFWSGDVHHAEISGREGYLEVTSSGLTHHCGQPKLYGRLCRPLLENFHEHRYRGDTFYIGLNFGVLDVDWTERVATVQIKNAQGETVLQVQQSLDQSISKLPSYQGLPHTWDGHLIPWLWRLLLSLLMAFAMVLFYKTSVR